MVKTLNLTPSLPGSEIVLQQVPAVGHVLAPFIVAPGVFHRVGKEVGVDLGHQALVHRQGQVLIGHDPGPGVDLDVALLELVDKQVQLRFDDFLGNPGGPPPQDELALLEVGQPEQGLDKEADPFVVLLQVLVVALQIVDQAAEDLLGIRTAPDTGHF